MEARFCCGRPVRTCCPGRRRWHGGFGRGGLEDWVPRALEAKEIYLILKSSGYAIGRQLGACRCLEDACLRSGLSTKKSFRTPGRVADAPVPSSQNGIPRLLWHPLCRVAPHPSLSFCLKSLNLGVRTVLHQLLLLLPSIYPALITPPKINIPVEEDCLPERGRSSPSGPRDRHPAQHSLPTTSQERGTAPDEKHQRRHEIGGVRPARRPRGQDGQ